MTITEIALLHVSSDLSIENEDLRSKLAHAKIVMQDYTIRSFYYLQQIEDPSYIYIVGEWDSLDQHVNHFIPGRENQAVLESLKDKISVDWLLHIDATHVELPLPKTSTNKAKAYDGKLVWSVVRHFVKEGEKDRFQKTFDVNKHCLQEFVTEGSIGGGWRVDNDGNEEEFVLLCPWTKVEQHSDFAKTEGFMTYGQIREHIDSAEIKHARFLDI
ncbi:Nn.00g019990.m01.CDS01 [Neocucurbitaria sp. VM-36]